jgi:pimeloyl-ACP methyl ester carboxylesterase
MADIRTEFPYRVEVVDPFWIDLSDGTRIATTLWRPVTDAKVPAVVEMVPYRRRDGTVARDMDMDPWFAGHGIAYCRVDIRGAGDSGGQLADEYLPREQEDAVEIIARLAALPWCNGNVGMTGISWGGFNSLQVAARRPPALKAIITHCATDDRYSDDIHYMGGALLTEHEMWSNFMLLNNGGAARSKNRRRGLARHVGWSAWTRTRSLSETWLAHQRRDEFWKQGSVCEDFSGIECAVMAVCGWDDSATRTSCRACWKTCPRQSLRIIGPWSHMLPVPRRAGTADRLSPGGAALVAPLARRRGRPASWTSRSIAPGFQARKRSAVLLPPRPCRRVGGGRAVAERRASSCQVLHLNEAGLGSAPGRQAARSVRSPATAGRDCGRWGGYGGACPDMAIDQRREDGLALCFDTSSSRRGHGVPRRCRDSSFSSPSTNRM